MKSSKAKFVSKRSLIFVVSLISGRLVHCVEVRGLGIQQIEVKKRVCGMVFLPAVLLYCEFDALIAVIVR